jgi:hypothetical protein
LALKLKSFRASSKKLKDIFFILRTVPFLPTTSQFSAKPPDEGGDFAPAAREQK